VSRAPVILVPDAHTRASLAAIRSLGRAGYEVHAASPMVDAMGLRSRYASAAVVSPAMDGGLAADWLLEYARLHDVRMIVPSSSVVAAALHRWEAFKPLLPITDDADVVRRIFNKADTFELYRDRAADGLLDHHPPTLLFREGDPISAASFAGLRPPYFVKAAAQEAKRPLKDLLARFDSPEDVVGFVLDRLNDDYRRVLVQGAARGRQVGVSAMLTPAGARVVNCVLDGHLKPHSNGTMSLRRTWWHEGIVEDALRRLEAHGWIGCAMVEYVWDEATDAFDIIEINPRFWQYLHLDLHAGVDFPLMQARWFLDGVEPVQPRPRPAACRDTFPGEFAMLTNMFRDPRAGVAEKLAAVAGFVANSLRPSLHADLSFPGDRALYFAEARRFLRGEVDSAKAKLLSGKSVTYWLPQAAEPPAAAVRERRGRSRAGAPVRRDPQRRAA